VSVAVATSRGSSAAGDPRSGRRGRLVRRAILLVLALVVIAVVGGVVYFSIPQPDLPEAAAALQSTDAVDVTQLPNGDLEFAPRGGATATTTGLILYPGGKVDPKAYAPAAREIAAAGFFVAIVSMPLNLAVLDVDAGTRVIERHLEIRTWAVGGHSLGGSMAAEYAARQAHAVSGLVLWSSYSAVDLSATRIQAVVIYGTLDAGAARMTSQESLGKLRLPVLVRPIEGGNHEQMGWYTGQPNDPPATISREAQQARVVAETVSFLVGLRP
jgi:hypothetical protein